MDSDFDMGDLPPLDDILSDAGMGEKERVVDPNADRDVILVCNSGFTLDRVIDYNPRARPVLSDANPCYEDDCKEILAPFLRSLARNHSEKEIYVCYHEDSSTKFSKYIPDLINVFPLRLEKWSYGQEINGYAKRVIDRSCVFRHF